MAYQDHIPRSSDDKPNCWGNANTYDPNDFECQGCRYQHSCRAEVNMTGGTRRAVNIRPSVINTSGPSRRYYRRDDDDGVAANYQTGIVEEDEKPIERFAKDCAAGALRGLFYEAWQFMKQFRFR